MIKNENTPVRSSSRLNRWSRRIGILIGLVGVAYVIDTLLRNKEEVLAVTSQARPLILVSAYVTGAAGMTAMGLAWRVAVRILGSTIGIAPALRGYFLGQLGKYVPGGVWAIMGRAEWARTENVPAQAAYASVALAIGATQLAALLLATVLLPFASSGPLEDSRIIAVFALLPIGFALLHPHALQTLTRVAGRLTRRRITVPPPSWRSSTWLVLRHVPGWLLVGATYVAIATALGISGAAANIIFAATLSWTIGFLALPVPGGIGVREAVFVALATSLPAGIAATVALLARILFIVIDATGAALMSVLLTRRPE